MDASEFDPERAPSDADPFPLSTPAPPTGDPDNPSASPPARKDQELATLPARVLGTVLIGWCTYLSMRFAYELADRAAKVRYRPPGCDIDATTTPSSDVGVANGIARCVGEVRRVEWVASWRAEAVWAAFAIGALLIVLLWIAAPLLDRRTVPADQTSPWDLGRGDWVGFTLLLVLGALGWWIGLISTFSFPPGPGLSPADPWLDNLPTAVLTIGASIAIGVFYGWIFRWKRWTPTEEERRRDERRPWFRLSAAAASWLTTGLVTLMTIQPGAGQRPWFSTTLQLLAMTYAAVTTWMLTKRAGLRR